MFDKTKRMNEDEYLELAKETRNMTVADSLLMVDYPEGLTDIELAFCRHHAEGKPPARAYMAAQCDAGEPMNKASGGKRAGDLLRRPEVAAYLKKLRQAMEKHCVARGGSLMSFLTAIVFTPIDEIDGQSVLCHKKTVTSRTDREGTTTTSTTYEMPSKMEAVKQLSKMQGLDAPTTINHNHSGGVMVMPFTKDVQEWSQNIAAQQKALMDDALDI